MTTTMHRLQISLPERQRRYLAERAQRDRVSLAEVIRRLLERAAAEESPQPAAESAVIAEASPAYRASPTPPPPGEVILRLPADLYQRLRQEATRAGKPAAAIAQEWLVERLAASPRPEPDEGTRVLEVLRASGKLVELDPELQKRADPTISLEEVQAALDRAGGKPLSQIILEQRGSKG